MSSNKILIVEDEPHISDGLKLNLTLLGHDAHVADTGTKGLEMWKTLRPDLIILDLMLPEIDGVEVLKRIRAEDERVPILILSAKDQSQDKIRCFTKGVDDYLTKPFNLDEFLLRVKRLLERATWNTPKESTVNHFFEGDEFTFSGIRVDFIQSNALREKEVIKLTAQELKILRLLFKSPGIPLQRDFLLDQGWGYGEEMSTRTLDNFIVRFRKYFEEEPRAPRHFISIRSVGYQFNP